MNDVLQEEAHRSNENENLEAQNDLDNKISSQKYNISSYRYYSTILFNLNLYITLLHFYFHL